MPHATSTGFLSVVFTVAFAVAVWAQGIQTGTIRGSVKDAQGLAVPGVTVTATSPALQGPRTTVSSSDGEFTIAALPPGPYVLSLELAGFANVTRQTDVPIGSTINEV